MNKPYLVIEWNDTQTEAVGWLVIYNFVKGSAGGGTRMHPSVTKEEVIRLARAMAYKYQAIESKVRGGCKAGIVYDYKAPDAQDVLKRFITAMAPYIANGVYVGGDLGTSYSYIMELYKEMGIGQPQTPAMRQNKSIQENMKGLKALMGQKWDGFLTDDMITGYGVAYTIDEAWKFMGHAAGGRVVIQGFGCVGASCANLLYKLGYKIVGIADVNTLLYCPDGLDVPTMVAERKPFGEINRDNLPSNYENRPNSEWLSVDCGILVPSALEDVINKDTVGQVKASLIAEGANIPVTAEADAELHRRGVAVVPDFIANMGAIRYYYAVVNGLIDAEMAAVVQDLENISRKNTHQIFELAKKSGRYQRDVALEIFTPTTQDTPEIN